MSERHDHSRNYIGKVRIELCAKSFILRVYDVLARHRSILADVPGPHERQSLEYESVPVRVGNVADPLDPGRHGSNTRAGSLASAPMLERSMVSHSVGCLKAWAGSLLAVASKEIREAHPAESLRTKALRRGGGE
jgi:hypothetical protein